MDAVVLRTAHVAHQEWCPNPASVAFPWRGCRCVTTAIHGDLKVVIMPFFEWKDQESKPHIASLDKDFFSSHEAYNVRACCSLCTPFGSMPLISGALDYKAAKPTSVKGAGAVGEKRPEEDLNMRSYIDYVVTLCLCSEADTAHGAELAHGVVGSWAKAGGSIPPSMTEATKPWREALMSLRDPCTLR